MSVYYSDDRVTLHLGDALDVAHTLPDGAADCIVTSPPYYGLRDMARHSVSGDIDPTLRVENRPTGPAVN